MRAVLVLTLSFLTALLAGCSGGVSTSRTDNTDSNANSQTAAAPAITAQPAGQSVGPGAQASFSVSATGPGLSYQWQKNGAPIAGATSSSYTTPTASGTDDGASYTVVVTNAAGSVTSSGARLTVTTTSVSRGTDVVTYKNDLARTGQNLSESSLTPANVNTASFGKLRFLATDGKVDAQPLYLSALTVGGAAHNVVFVATENDTVYAFDADSGTTLWHVSLLGSGESPSDSRGCSQVTPVIGITSTPVIDRSAGPHGAIYVVAMSNGGSYHQRLHALDVTTGAELFGGPTEISATFAAAGGATITFDPAQYAERAALLLVNGLLYTTWTSHCDIAPYTGWIISFSQTTLKRVAVYNVAGNGTSTGYASAGPAIWMSGGGPAADAAGNVYLLTGNGAFETSLNSQGFPAGGDYGNSFVKLSGTTSLAVADYFTMSNEVAESQADEDLGSGGAMLLPDLTDSGGTVRHLVVGAGKDGNLYVVNRDSMGKFSSSGNHIWQELDGALSGGIRATPAWFNGTVYYGPTSGRLLALPVSAARVAATPSSQSGSSFVYPGTAPAVSANGTANGIIWAHQNSDPAVLHAYDAANLAHELYNSSQAANGRDQFGAGNKFITPTIADGKVFVGTQSGVAVFGLLN
jgi:outer membrane protein assembly factor BamB